VVISLLLQSSEFWWYLLLTSSMLLHDVIMTSYCWQRYAECLVTTVFQQDSAVAHCAMQVQQLCCCVQKCQTFLHRTCGLQTAQFSVPWITRSGLSCSIVSTTDKSIVWMNWNGGSLMSGAVLNSRLLARLLTSTEEDIKHGVHVIIGLRVQLNWESWFRPSISNNRTGFDRPSDRPYLVQPAHSTQSPLTRLPSGVLCFAGETGEWGRGADTAVYPTTAATHHSNLKQLIIPYQLLQQQAGQRDVVRPCNIVDSVGIGRPMLCACWLWHTDFLSRRVAYAQATRRLFVHVGLRG